MARKQKPTAKAIKYGTDPLHRAFLETITPLTKNAIKYALAKATEIADLENPNRAAESKYAEDFLKLTPHIFLALEHADRKDALKAAIFFGLQAFQFLPHEGAPGKVLKDILKSYAAHAKGGRNSKLLKNDGDLQKVKEALEKHGTGKRRNYKAVVAELRSQNIKGRDGDNLSKKTIARLRKELEEEDIGSVVLRFIYSDN